MTAHVSLTDDVRIASEIAGLIAASGIDADDPDFATLIESECDVIERLRRILRAARHEDAQAKALAEMIAEMRDRKARRERKVEGLRSAVLWAMGELGLKKIDAPDLTATVSAGRPKVVITDETALPDDVCVISRTPSKQAIALALQEGAVPGAEYGNPHPTLTVRVR